MFFRSGKTWHAKNKKNTYNINDGGSSFRAEESVDIDTSERIVAEELEFVNYTVDVLHEGYYDVELAITNKSTGGQVQVVSGLESSQLLPVPDDGTVTGTLYLDKGPRAIKVLFDDNAVNDYVGDVAWLRITPVNLSLITSPTQEYTGQGNANVNNDPRYEVGTQFAVDVRGEITRLAFYVLEGESDNNTRVLHLWDQAGNELAEAEVNATGFGWKYADIDPVEVMPGLYTVSVRVKYYYPTAAFTIFPPAVPNVISFVAATYSNDAGAFPTHHLGHYGFTDVMFTPSYVP